jgi:hypothetical protein
LRAEVLELRQGDAEVLELRARVAALEAQKVLPPGVNDERIDRALEVEMLERQEAATAPEDSTPADRPGVLVRTAQRLERLLYRKG